MNEIAFRLLWVVVDPFLLVHEFVRQAVCFRKGKVAAHVAVLSLLGTPITCHFLKYTNHFVWLELARLFQFRSNISCHFCSFVSLQSRYKVVVCRHLWSHRNRQVVSRLEASANRIESIEWSQNTICTHDASSSRCSVAPLPVYSSRNNANTAVLSAGFMPRRIAALRIIE